MVINKIDRVGARPHEVLDMVFDLFCELNASDEQLDFPIVYSNARRGCTTLDLNTASTSMEPLFAVIESNVRPPGGSPAAPFQMLVANIDYNDYIGRIATGKVFNGSGENRRDRGADKARRRNNHRPGFKALRV